MLFKKWHPLWLPKGGNTREEYEDAANGDSERYRFAFADGASESSYAGPWARLLVDGFLQASTPDLLAWIAPLRERWLKDLGEGPFPWYTETKIDHGAFATFLGLTLEKKKRRCKEFVVWNAIAVGDSCIFQVRAGRAIRKFPLQRFEEFDNSPGLICSRSHPGGSAYSLERTAQNKVCKPGDKLWLMTDALAMWFLQKDFEGMRPWEELEKIVECPEPQTAFETWTEQRREAFELRNDDVTLLVICF